MKSGGQKYVKRQGLKVAAKKLGVTYSHLRKVVTGERQSWDLYADYLTLTLKDDPQKLKEALSENPTKK